jgi:hypothetical protein
MRNWTSSRLLGYLLAKSLCCPLVPATGAIRFREWSSARRTTKSSFVDKQRDLMHPECDISFHTLACIMYLSTHFSTGRAGFALFSRSHLHLDISVSSNALAHDLELWQIERHDDPLLWLALSSSLLVSGMFLWHRLSFVRCGFLFSTSSNEEQAHCLVPDSFFLPSLCFHPNG